MTTTTDSRYTSSDRHLRIPAKTLDLYMQVDTGDLCSNVKKAFDIAKSSGHELRLVFVGAGQPTPIQRVA